MLRPEDILTLAGVIAAGIALVFVVRWRRKDYAENMSEAADDHCCDHLRPALDDLLSRGARIARVGQRARDYPMEIHMDQPFDCKEIYDRLKMEPPANVSERNVLFCKEDYCEIQPRK